MSDREALQVALDIFRSPALVRKVKSQPLPKRVLPIIRIAAGEAIEEHLSDSTHGWKETDIRSAAVFFLQQILFDKNADDFRILGLTSDASLAEVKDHKRALMKWLHPDRNNNKWENALLQRLLEASKNVMATFDSPEEENRNSVSTVATKKSQLQPVRRRHRHASGTQRVKKTLYLKAHIYSFLRYMGFAFAIFAGFVLANIFFEITSANFMIEVVRNTIAWVN
jgi:hypothetical protein